MDRDCTGDFWVCSCDTIDVLCYNFLPSDVLGLVENFSGCYSWIQNLL